MKPFTPFLCNICALPSVRRTAKIDRERATCLWCGSNVRFRATIDALSLRLHGKSLPLPLFPKQKDRAGFGMSDWDGYALRLAKKLGYTNTYYHQEPLLDITAPPAGQLGRYEFIISGDVMEHIQAPIDRAFENVFKLLKKGGVFVLTVPFRPTGEIEEHYPDLHDFQIVSEDGKKRLRNKTRDGRTQSFDNLVFHGGEGAALEMRIFSLPSLKRLLTNAGFTDIQLHNTNVARYGILQEGPFGYPLSAKK